MYTDMPTKIPTLESAIPPQKTSNDGGIFLTRTYEQFLIFFVALLPLFPLLYIYFFQDPQALFVDHGFHEIAIGIAILQSAFVSYVTWRCYVSSGEPLLRWLTLSFTGFTLIYVLHGIFTPLSPHHMALFLLFGPVSRFVMAGCLLVGLLTYGKPHHLLAQRVKATFWRGWIAAFLMLDILVAWVALSLPGLLPIIRISVEASALALILAGIVFIFARRISSWMMVVYLISLSYLALSSLAFLLAKPWNHLWWLAHIISAGGFTILSYGVIRAFHTTRAFSQVYSQEEILKRLSVAQAASEEHAQHLKKILDNLFAYVTLLDIDGTIREVNKEPLEQAGVLREDVIGQYLFDSTWWAYDNNVREQLIESIAAARQGQSRRYDAVVKMGDDFVPIDFQISPVTDEQGRIVSLLTIGVDIAGRKFAESQLRVSEENRRLLEQQKLVQTSLDGFFVLSTKDARFTEVNEAFCGMLGYTRKELLTMHISDLEAMETWDQTAAHINQIIEVGYERFETCLRHKQQNLINIEASVSYSESRGGVFFVFVRDITERKQTERMLKNSRDQLLTFIQQAPVSIAMFDRDMNYLAASDLWLASSGRKYADLIGRNNYELFPDIPSEWKAVHQQALAGATLKNNEDLWIMGDGSKRWLRWAVLPWTDQHNAIGGIIIMSDDITAQKQMQAEIQERRLAQQKERDLLLKQKVADQTAAAIAHELNQPLLAIASYSDTALMQLQAENPNLEIIHKAVAGSNQQAQRAGKSIRELLDFLRMKRFATDRFDINQEILDVVDVIKTEHQLRFNSILNFENGLPLVLANRSHIRKVLLNLLCNGIEAMQDAGVPQPSITVTVSTKKDDYLVQITVQDNGPGIEKKNLHRVFDPFFTTKANGIGMGLAISRSLIEENAGQLWVEPQEGPGAIFHITLPFAT